MISDNVLVQAKPVRRIFYGFRVTVTTWPVSHGYCKKYYDFKKWYFLPPNHDNCFIKLKKLNVKRTASKKFRQLYLSNDYFDIVIGENKFREDI